MSIKRYEWGLPGAHGLAAFAALFIMDLGETVMAAFSFYLYGEQAAAIVAREQPRWQAWIQERFPTPTEASESA